MKIDVRHTDKSEAYILTNVYPLFLNNVPGHSETC